MPMEFIDTHAHLYAKEFEADIAQVVALSRDNYVRKIYMPNIDLATIEVMLAIERLYPDLCAAMIGLHPCHVGPDFQALLKQLDGWLAQRSFAAIGEIGMDLYHDKTYQAQQEEAFSIQLNWAKQHKLPVVIHSRASMEVVLRVLEAHQDGNLKGIFHCFGGSVQEAKHIIALGFYLGIGGVVTFKNSGLLEVVASIDLQHLVLETDAPYLAPAPHRGKRNQPAYLLYIAEKIAEIKQIPLETVAEITTANAMNVFS